MIPEKTFEYSDVVEELSLDGKYLHLGEDFARCGWVDDNPACTESEYNTALLNAKKKYKDRQYQRDRKLEYPTIEELVVALYDESDKASIIEKRNAVKAKYPKPE